MENLTNTQLYKIFQESKTSKFAKEPDFSKVIDTVATMLNVVSNDELNADIKTAYSDYVSMKEKHRHVSSGARGYEEVTILYRNNYVSKSLVRPAVKRPVTELSDRSQRRRLSDYVQSSSKRAVEEGVSPTKLFAYGLKNKYSKNKKVGMIGKNLFDGEPTTSDYLSLSAASAIYDCGKMTKRTYIEIRLLCKKEGKDIFPPYDNLDLYRKERRPTQTNLEEPYVGVKFDYAEALKKSAQQLIRSISLPMWKNITEVHLNIHDGLDGSGGHSIFNQLGSEETHNIIMYMFRVENVATKDGKFIWTNPAHASASSCRPVMLLMGKETRENVTIVGDLQKERSNCNFSVTHCDKTECDCKTIDVKVNAKMSMIDGKLHSLLTGLGGAFCCLCTYSEDQCNDLDYINAGFRIDRSLEQTLQICESDIHLEQNRRKGDYEVRKGVTQEPITTEDHNNLHPLHNLLRCFGWIYKICYHATAGHLDWSEAKLSVTNRVGRALQFLKQAKESIQQTVKDETGIMIERPDPTGHGGTTTTGNVPKLILNNSNRHLLTKGIDSLELKTKIDSIILNMAVILSVINSNRKVDIPQYSELCKRTSLLVKSIPWIKINPSAHLVLAHSAEVIEGNNCCGLLNFTECGIEANNKYLRQYRINYARKTNQHDNLHDCLNRLWDKSDPLVHELRNRLHCSHCGTDGHTPRSCQVLKDAVSSCNTDFEGLFSLVTL